jgi:hypothetical protein
MSHALCPTKCVPKKQSSQKAFHFIDDFYRPGNNSGSNLRTKATSKKINFVFFVYGLSGAQCAAKIESILAASLLLIVYSHAECVYLSLFAAARMTTTKTT